MLTQSFLKALKKETEELKCEGLYKTEQIITSPQSAEITVDESIVLNLCANNYLGLANHPELIKAAVEGLKQYGLGLASVRFICGTQSIHKDLESAISSFLGMEDTILFSSCFDANTGLFETILGPDDAVISDTLNHASIIDGIRLCKAKRYKYANNNINNLEECLKQADTDGAHFKLIATDGVFSMDGIIADLKSICDLADRYKAIVMVDDSHAVGFVGENGRGTHEYCDVMNRVDIITGTLGKALGGVSGGYASGKKEIVKKLRQRSRPYLFSNSLPPSVVCASIKAISMLRNNNALRKRLWENVSYFRKKMTEAGFILAGNGHAIIPVVIGDAKTTDEMAKRMRSNGVYVTGFSYPVVPRNQARIRTQISSAHTRKQLDKALETFIIVGTEMKIIKGKHKT